MAEAFLSVLLENLSSLIKGEIGSILGVDDEMKKLSSTLTTIQAVLEDAEDKQVENKPLRNWLRKLNDLAFEIDDVLDECATEVAMMKHKNRKWSPKKLKEILYDRRKIGRKIKQVAGKLDAIAKERKNFGLHESEIVVEKRQSKFAATRETSSVLNEPDKVYGRDGEKDKIVDILVNQVRDCPPLSILPIIGIGGLGKTTLAQLVFNDPQVSEHFDMKLWVCVSDNFDYKTLLKAIIESVTSSASASGLMSVDTLERKLQELLSQKRFLLILDDVWDHDQGTRAKLHNVLACGLRGASVIVTTRLKRVADIMGTLRAYCLKGLADEYCYLLFKQCAFGQEIADYCNLESIGRQIVKKCAGVPLAAKALGGLLRFKRSEKEWVYVKESELWNLPHDEYSILPALRLSYRHLSVELRRCFAYCAIFPKDYNLEKEELIFLWMAHGCISSNGMMEVEDVGKEVWNELVLRSLLIRSDIEGRNTFKMHDLVHDLAQSIMENKVPETQRERSGGSALSDNKIRHTSLRDNRVAFPVRIEDKMDISSTLMRFRRLRMLDTSYMRIEVLPPAIGKLKHLRSLNLVRNSFQSLPDTICGLWNLQILNLSYCHMLISLPKRMTRMRNLCHLFLEGCSSLSKMPYNISELSSLKTLSVFIVDHERANQLGDLRVFSLGGVLEIRHLERVKNLNNAKKANLIEKSNLHDLVLEWEGDGASTSQVHVDEEVLEALVPHPNLEKLKIRGFRGRFLPHWMRNPVMEKLTRIEMKDCVNCSHLSLLGNLPCLNYLRLESLSSLEYIFADDVQSGSQVVKTKFPSLESLFLQNLPNLKRLFKEEKGEIFPNLRRLRIMVCNLLTWPLLSSLKESIGNCTQSTLSSFCNFGNLASLSIDITENKYIRTEALVNLHNLKELTLITAHEQCLQVEGLRGFKSLKSLSLVECKTMTCLPDAWFRHLTDLERIDLFDCPKLVELPEGTKFLHSLTHLKLYHLESMVRLPEVIQHIPQLRHLELRDLPELSSLPDWLANVTSLENLDLYNCPRLASLPTNIHRMANLKSLKVFVCHPELHRHFEREKGKDWHKIARTHRCLPTVGN